MSEPCPPVVIIGAGPSGLTLARYLQIHHVPCVIYERETSSTARSQGGSLDLHDDTGIAALKATGLYDEAVSKMRPEGEAMKIIDKDGKVWWDDNGGTSALAGEGRPEIDRTDLRDILLNSLKADTIKWGHSVESCRAISDSSYEVSFKSQPSITTSILIGADGTFSRIRPLLHSTKPPYCGVSMYELHIPASNVTPRLREYMGQGASFILGDKKGLIPQANSNGKYKVYVGMAVEEKWMDESPLPQQGKREFIKKMFDGWTEEVGEIIMASEEGEITQRKLFAFDPYLKWDSALTGVTIMGDAAHVMSPFAGEGVNQAMADALSLGQTLVDLYTVPPLRASLAPFPLSLFPIRPPPQSNPTIRPPPSEKLHAALRRFEKTMMSRAREYMIESKINLEVAFGDDGARGFRNRFYWMFAEAIWGVTLGLPIKWIKSWLE